MSAMLMLAVHCLSALQVYNEMFTDATSERTERMFHYLDPDNTGYVDYLGWSQSIKLQVRNLIMITRYRTCCRTCCSSTCIASSALLRQ